MRIELFYRSMEKLTMYPNRRQQIGSHQIEIKDGFKSFKKPQSEPVLD